MTPRPFSRSRASLLCPLIDSLCLPLSSAAALVFVAGLAAGYASPAAAQTTSAAAASTAAKPQSTKPAASNAQVARGRYIVNSAACHDCHTPWQMGPRPRARHDARSPGHPAGFTMPPAPTLPEGPWITLAGATMTAWHGPWGTSFTANLTPDPETGIGRWTEADFLRTIRTGRHLGRGREILPPMPIAVYNNLTDADLKAVFAYLRTVPPVNNKVPEPRPPVAAASAPR